jgi:uncharacterized protein YjiK
MRYADREKEKKNIYRRLIGLVAVGMTVYVGASKLVAGSQSRINLQLKDEWRLQLDELSGIGLRQKADGAFDILAIGDRNALIKTASWREGRLQSDDKGPLETSSDIAPLILERFPLCEDDAARSCKALKQYLTTDWEALALDGKGNVLTLQEGASNLMVFDPTLSSIRSMIHLSFVPLLKKREEMRAEQENSLGEGLLLLKQGHVLVAKEKDPTRLIEFGPAAAAPLGVTSQTLLGMDEEFAVPAAASAGLKPIGYEPLKVWRVKGFKKCDISDLTRDKEGHIYILSQKCRKVGRVHQLGVDDEVIKVDEVWGLPKAIRNPEAIAVAPDGSIFIGSDIGRHKPNLFRLEVPAFDNRVAKGGDKK